MSSPNWSGLRPEARKLPPRLLCVLAKVPFTVCSLRSEDWWRAWLLRRPSCISDNPRQPSSFDFVFRFNFRQIHVSLAAKVEVRDRTRVTRECPESVCSILQTLPYRLMAG